MDSEILESNGKFTRRSSPFLVTGAAGFVGSHLVGRLLERGDKVRAFVRSKAQAAELERLGVETFVGDIADVGAVLKAAEGVQGIFHIAALFRKAALPDQEFRRVNVEGVRSVFEAAVESGVPRVIHCSTVGVHGDIENPPADESAPFCPGDMYQETKLEGELLARQYFRQGSVHGVVIRPAMIYGPGDIRTLKIFKMIAARRFFYVGSGDKLVHWVDVRDLVDGFILAMEKQELNDEVFILAGREALPLSTMVSEVSRLLEVPEPWLHLPVLPMQLLGTIVEKVCEPLKVNPPIFRRRVDFFTKNRSFDTAKSRDLLGFEPKSCMVEELRQIIGWYESHGLLPQRASVKPIQPIENVAASSMVRRVDGLITEWGDSGLYGFAPNEALGTQSHGLLRTEFPCSLASINDKLWAARSWEGPLIHTRRDGEKIEVGSRWELRHDERTREPMVFEVNEPTLRVAA